MLFQKFVYDIGSCRKGKSFFSFLKSSVVVSSNSFSSFLFALSQKMKLKVIQKSHLPDFE